MTQRDRWTSALLPALAVVLAYNVWTARPLLRGLREIRRELAVQEPAVARETRRVETVATTRTLEKELAEAVAANTSETAIVDLGRRRLETLKVIAGLCEDLGVRLLEATPGGTSTQGTAVAPTGLPAHLEKAGWMHPQGWTLTLRGSYPAVRKVLDGLRERAVPVLPTRLDMRAADEPSQPHSWLLGVWM